MVGFVVTQHTPVGWCLLQQCSSLRLECPNPGCLQSCPHIISLFWHGTLGIYGPVGDWQKGWQEYDPWNSVQDQCALLLFCIRWKNIGRLYVLFIFLRITYHLYLTTHVVRLLQPQCFQCYLYVGRFLSCVLSSAYLQKTIKLFSITNITISNVLIIDLSPSFL